MSLVDVLSSILATSLTPITLILFVLYVAELNPMPTEEICTHFNELRSDMVLLHELKTAYSTCEFELQTLRHQYEALCPGKVSQQS